LLLAGCEVPRNVATDEVVGVTGHRIFAETYCQLIAFEMELNPENFDVETFLTAFEPFTKAEGKVTQPRVKNTCGSRSKDSDYHLHLTWHREKDPPKITLTVEFARGNQSPRPNEKEPFAEDFVVWLGRFVKEKQIHVEVYADFEFPRQAGRRVKFPLPMKAPVGPDAVEAEIDGISFTLFPTPQGVEKVWITQKEENLTVHLHGKRVVTFGAFDPHEDVQDLSGVMDSMFKPRRQEMEVKTQ
jgi:hypothetical protein